MLYKCRQGYLFWIWIRIWPGHRILLSECCVVLTEWWFSITEVSALVPKMTSVSEIVHAPPVARLVPKLTKLKNSLLKVAGRSVMWMCNIRKWSWSFSSSLFAWVIAVLFLGPSPIPLLSGIGRVGGTCVCVCWAAASAVFSLLHSNMVWPGIPQCVPLIWFSSGFSAAGDFFWDNLSSCWEGVSLVINHSFYRNENFQKYFAYAKVACKYLYRSDDSHSNDRADRTFLNATESQSFIDSWYHLQIFLSLAILPFVEERDLKLRIWYLGQMRKL